MFAYTRDNQLMNFNAGAPGTILSTRAVTGLQANETILSMDFQPSTGDLIGISSQSRLYRLNVANAVATAVSATPFTPPVISRNVGCDIDPVQDELRISTEADRNVRIDPNTGQFIGADPNFVYAAGDPHFGQDVNLVGLAYSNSYFGASESTLYGIESGHGTLVRIDDPSSGAVTTVGDMGIQISGLIGFDVSENGFAVAATVSPGVNGTQMYGVRLDTGAITLLGTIGTTARLRALAVRPASTPRMFGVTSANELVTFRPGQPGTLISTRPIAGLSAGETVLGIDCRPSDATLWALGSTNRLYRLDPTSAVATAVGTGFTTPLAGATFGIDFSPVFGALRVVSDVGENLRINPLNGEIAATDIALAYDPSDPNAGTTPGVVALANSNNDFGASLTTTYAIDATTDSLVRVGSPDGIPNSAGTGVLTTVGELGIDVGTVASFDISAHGAAYAAIATAGSPGTTLFRIDLISGQATEVDNIGPTSLFVGSFAIEPPPVLRAIGLDTQNRLVSFLPGNPAQISSTQTILGLQANETIHSIDFEPVSGRLFAYGSSGRLYTINRTNALATAIGTGPIVPLFAGTHVSIETDPGAETLRAVSELGENVTIDLETGTVASTDAPLNFVAGDPNEGNAPVVAALGMTLPSSQQPITDLYGIDSQHDALVRFSGGGGPADGRLSTVGTILSNTSLDTGFDVTQFGVGIASLRELPADSSRLFRIDLAGGEATLLGTIGGAPLRDLTILPRGL